MTKKGLLRWHAAVGLLMWLAVVGAIFALGWWLVMGMASGLGRAGCPQCSDSAMAQIDEADAAENDRIAFYMLGAAVVVTAGWYTRRRLRAAAAPGKADRDDAPPDGPEPVGELPEARAIARRG